MWNDGEDFEDFEDFEEIYHGSNWALKINGEITYRCDEKTDLMDFLLNYLDEYFVSLEKSFLDIKFDEEIEDIDDLYDCLLTMGFIEFENTLKLILDYYNCDFIIKVINYDGEQPEFGEL